MTKDQETPVTETPNSGESGQKTSKPKTRVSARGKSATAAEATAGQAEKTSSRSSPASKISSGSSLSADTPAPKASKPKAGKSAAPKSVAASKSTDTKPESAEEASAVKGAAPKAVEKTATKAKSSPKTAAKSKSAAGSKSEAEEKSVKKTVAKTEKKAASSAVDSKPATAKASAAKSKQTTAKSGAKPVSGTAKSGSQDAPVAKTASAESAQSMPKAAEGTATAKTAAATAPAGNAAPNAGQAPKSAAKTGEKLPVTDAARAAAGAAAVNRSAQSSLADDTAADGAHKAGAKPASAARSRAATRARAATARKKTTVKSAEKTSAGGKAATAELKSDATAKTPVRAAEKISPPPAGAVAPAQAMPKDQPIPKAQAPGSASEGKDLTSPAPAARTAEPAAEYTAQQPDSTMQADRAKPAASPAAPAGAVHAAAKNTTAVLALASTERLALTGRDSLAIESTEMLALTVTTSEAVSPGENGTDADAASEASGEAPRRKNRRGRRGGRGRNRKKEQNGENGETLTAGTSVIVDARADDAQQDEEEQLSAAGSQAAAVNGTASDGAAARESSGAAPTADSKKTAPTESGKHKSKSESAGTRRRMFISVLPGEQVEVALTEDGQLLEYYLDMLHQRKIKGNIYKGVIHNIDTNLQAAFVSYGAGKNGFLQIDEIHPEYWLTHHEPAKGKKFPPIQKVLKAGQEVLVQVVKEPTGSKGAFLTTWLSLAGRFLVLTPGQEQIGVSRKVDDEEERSRLREMMNGIDPGQGLGVIVRTVSAGTTKTTLKNDLQYLKRVWRDIRKKATEVTAPALIYQEPGLSERAVRDYLTEDVGEIWVDHEDVAQSIRETVNLLFPRKSDLVRLHSDVRTSMWERFSLRRQLDQIYTREVLLPSGGRLVFDQTEALMAVDINSGKISGKGNFEAMAHKTNMEAAETIARHLKLRDIGGQVVIDFIEMRDKKHIIEVEKTLRSAMKNDRARHDVGRMSAFGLLELVRQRTGSSALAITMEPCPACGGTGQRRNLEWQALQALRELRRMLRAESKEKCVYGTSAELALYLLNHKRDSLREMEQDYGKCLEISVRP